MRTISLAAGLLLMATAAPLPTIAHGTCAHEQVHTYDMPGYIGGIGASTVRDSETGDCDGDGGGGDFDGDLDIGSGGFAFGHGMWAEQCGYHVETFDTITVTDLAFGQTVAFMTGSNDASGPLDPAFPCVTDGFLSPSLDPDDCFSPIGVGTQPIVCPGGGDGLLWGFIFSAEIATGSGGMTGASPATLGTVTSP